MIAPENTPAGLAAAISTLLAAAPTRHETRCYAEAFGWGETSAGQLDIFRRVLRHTRQATGKAA
jgi:teichuronic acid biosynthesis glycosyltransferase TuaC